MPNDGFNLDVIQGEILINNIYRDYNLRFIKIWLPLARLYSHRLW